MENITHASLKITLDNCTECNLRKRLISFEEFKKDIEQLKFVKQKDYFEKIIPKFSNPQAYYALFHDDSKDYNREIMLVLQNPGISVLEQDNEKFEDIKTLHDECNENAIIGKSKVERIRKLHDACNENELIDFNKDEMCKYLAKDNSDFYSGFICKLVNCKMINIRESNESSKDYLFNNFIVTDIVKCLSTTYDLDHIKNTSGKKCAEICFKKHFSVELRRFLNSNHTKKLVIIFGSRTWNIIQDKLELVPTENSLEHNGKKYTPVTIWHGCLFYSEKREDLKNAYFIPLVHLSQRTFSMCLRDSYFDYFEEGLKKYKEK